MSVNLRGNILVTGTNRGIGLELVKQLAEKTGPETQIYASCRDPEGTRAEVVNILIVFTSFANTHICYTADEDSISAAFQAVSQKLGTTGLNLLINNAAINKPSAPGSLSATRKQDMMEVYETNVAGPFILTKVVFQIRSCFRVTQASLLFTDWLRAWTRRSSGERRKMKAQRLKLNTEVMEDTNKPLTKKRCRLFSLLRISIFSGSSMEP
uniref:Uncharacterized protein n=1 Tax=Poecilia mexicana TaxID=48701 RepID=A0A3B3YQ92_9TELE